MEIRIKKTNELKDLSIVDSNGIEWTGDLLGNNNAISYNNETEEYEMSEDDFEWWNEYITNYENDEKEIEELAEDLEIEKSEIWERVQELYTEMDAEHFIKQNIIAEFKESL